MQNTIVGTHLEGAKVWLQKCFRLSHHPQKVHNRIYEITQRPIEYDVMRGVTSTKCWGSAKKEITNSALGDRRELQWRSHIWPEYYRISGDFPGRKGREYFPEKKKLHILISGKWMTLLQNINWGWTLGCKGCGGEWWKTNQARLVEDWEDHGEPCLLGLWILYEHGAENCNHVKEKLQKLLRRVRHFRSWVLEISDSTVEMDWRKSKG